MHALACEAFSGTISNNVRLCSRDQNSKWQPSSQKIANIEHNFIDLCCVDIILFVAIRMFCHMRNSAEPLSMMSAYDTIIQDNKV